MKNLLKIQKWLLPIIGVLVAVFGVTKLLCCQKEETDDTYNADD